MRRTFFFEDQHKNALKLVPPQPVQDTTSTLHRTEGLTHHPSAQHALSLSPPSEKISSAAGRPTLARVLALKFSVPPQPGCPCCNRHELVVRPADTQGGTKLRTERDKQLGEDVRVKCEAYVRRFVKCSMSDEVTICTTSDGVTMDQATRKHTQRRQPAQSPEPHAQDRLHLVHLELEVEKSRAQGQKSRTTPQEDESHHRDIPPCTNHEGSENRVSSQATGEDGVDTQRPKPFAKAMPRRRGSNAANTTKKAKTKNAAGNAARARGQGHQIGAEQHTGESNAAASQKTQRQTMSPSPTQLPYQRRCQQKTKHRAPLQKLLRW